MVVNKLCPGQIHGTHAIHKTKEFFFVPMNSDIVLYVYVGGIALYVGGMK